MICRWIGAGIFLAAGTFWDIKEKRIPVVWILLGVLVGVVCMLYEGVAGEGNAGAYLSACLPGALFLLISMVTHEQMGIGDGITLLILGGILGAKRVWLIWLFGMGGVFLFGIFLLISRKGTGKTRIAFLPFLLVGFFLVAGGGI